MKILYDSTCAIKRLVVFVCAKTKNLPVAFVSAKNRLGLKSQAHSLSPLKWTEEFFSSVQRTLAISPEIDFRARFWFGEE